MSVPRPPRREPTTLTAEQAEQLMRVTADDSLHALWVILLTTGLRVGEAFALRWSNVDLPAVLVQQRHQQEGWWAQQESWPAGDFVFTTYTGTPLDQRAAWRATLRRLGLTFLRLHDLRHTYASLHLSAGVHPKLVQEELGYSTISMTIDTYSHVIPASVRLVADVTDHLLASPEAAAHA